MKFLRSVCLVIALQILLGQVVYASTPVLQDRVVMGKYSLVPKEPKSKKEKLTFAEITQIIEFRVSGLLTLICAFCPSSSPDKWKSADEYFPKPYNPNDSYPF